jgi:hypothetical protein
MMKGVFKISLDFELHWGGLRNGRLAPVLRLPGNGSDYTNYFFNTRQVIPEMLKLFAAHETHVTWA